MKSIEIFAHNTAKITIPIVGAMAIASCSENAPHPSRVQAEAGICESPPAFSLPYDGVEDAAADHSNWRWVVAHLDETPQGVGYRATYGANEQQQGGKRGLVLPEQNAHERGLAFSIGPGDVTFGVTVVASLGSVACDMPPKVKFSEVMLTEPQNAVKPPL